MTCPLPSKVFVGFLKVKRSGHACSKDKTKAEVVDGYPILQWRRVFSIRPLSRCSLRYTEGAGMQQDKMQV